MRSRSCCQGPYDGLYGLMSGVGEWVDACTGADGAADTCRVMGVDEADETFDCGTAVTSQDRSDAREDLGFRCCAL